TMAETSLIGQTLLAQDICQMTCGYVLQTALWLKSPPAFQSLPASMLLWRSSSREDVYNILWAVVFGFATLNILTLAARRFEPNRRGLTFGEMMAVLVVVLSMFLMIWELLNVFHILPIKLRG
ncbi:MAG: hypothetical protein WA824_15620, partial [Candidatus Sulfotelmatobacter sp.]